MPKTEPAAAELQAQPQAQPQGQPNGQAKFVNLEAVIQELMRVKSNPQAQDVSVEASHSAGTHKFEIIIKEKPMVTKANEVAATQEPQAVASGRRPWVRTSGWERLANANGKKDIVGGFPKEFLASMGII